MKKIALFALLQAFLAIASGQANLVKEIARIKSDPQYLWGEGLASTMEEADNAAQHFLISKISTTVASIYTGETRVVHVGGDVNTTENLKQVVKTYSQATLQHMEQIVVEEGSQFRVFRYVHESEVERMFADRQEKVLSFIEMGQRAERRNKVTDALQYYYWSYMLTKTLPSVADFKRHDSESGRDVVVPIWLLARIKDLLGSIRVEMREAQQKDAYIVQNLYITCNGEPVSNYTFSYFNGRSYVDMNTAKDGRAAIDLPQPLNELKIKTEYQFAGEARKMDPELSVVMDALGTTPFPEASLTVKAAAVSQVVASVPAGRLSAPTTESSAVAGASEAVALPQPPPDVVEKVVQAMGRVETAIKGKNYESVRPLFTPEGFKMFNDLVNYGNATIIGQPQYTVNQYDSVAVCKSIPMQFKFRNNRTFVEDVAFRFNAQQKIESVAFTLNKGTEDEILQKSHWPEGARQTIVDFMEDYQTAYALKRTDYLEDVFSDDALIITGTVLKPAPKNDGLTIATPRVQYKQYTKEEFIKQLRMSFASKEFINLHFSDCEVVRSNGQDIYGIQIHQQYSSNNYGDKGYLFLVVDLRGDVPIIHVRTWQPDKDPDFGYFDLSKFTF